jgi:CHAD domain-containing protein
MGAMPDLPLDQRQSADSAVRMILLALLDAIEANFEGTLADDDSEHLHDLRVACRRSRSALSQLKGVLPKQEVSRFIADLKWLGVATGPLRDLDVLLLDLPSYRETLGESSHPDLDALERLIRQRRSVTFRAVEEALISTRCKAFLDDWRFYLQENRRCEATRSTEPVIALADRRIRKARRRILKRARHLDRTAPAQDFHRVRIDGKKLRYLLEFFQSLYPKQEMTTLIRELKDLQDILGTLNDLQVQHALLSDLAGEPDATPTPGAARPPTFDRLTDLFEHRQIELRDTFRDAFAEFSVEPAQATYRRLFAGTRVN